MRQKRFLVLSLLLAALLSAGSFSAVFAAARAKKETASIHATPTDATQTDASPTDASPTDATPTDAAVCGHETTVIRDADPDVCEKPHFTGRVYCALCGQLLDEGAVVPAAGHRFRFVRQEPDAVMHEVVAVVVCEVCGLEKRIPLSEYNVAFPDGERCFADGAYLIVTEGVTAAEVIADCPEDSVLLTADGVTAAADQPSGSGMTLLFPSGRRYTVLLYGDADGDGKISPADARLALRISVALEESLDWRDKACHVTTDGKRAVTSADARLILRASVGLEDAALFGREPPADATPTDASPTDASPADVAPTDASPTDSEPEEAPLPGAHVCRWKGGVNFRPEPSAESLPMAVIPYGERVTVLDVFADHDAGATVYWGKIQFHDGTGWSMLQYFEPASGA